MLKNKAFLMFLTILAFLPGLLNANGLGDALTINTGSNPRGLIAVDLNGDGRAEAVVANFGAKTLIGQTTAQASQGEIKIFSQGIDGLAITATLATGNSPRGLAFGDLNGDGRPDLLASFYDDNTLGVYIQKEDGSFGSAVVVPVGVHPVGVAFARGFETNLVAVANYDSDSVSLFKSSADGTLKLISEVAAGVKPTDVEFYVDGAGGVSLVTANYFGNTVSVIPVNLRGVAGDVVTLAVAGNPCKIEVGDLTGDGLPDLAVAAFASSEVHVFAREGVRFKAEAEILKLTGLHPNGITLGDVVGQGSLAIVAADRDSDQVDVVTRGEDGQLKVLVNLDVKEEGEDKTFGPVEVAVADFTGDGLADILITHMRTGTLKLFAQSLPQAPALQSSSHPDQEMWFANSELNLSWDAVEDLLGIARYVYAVDQVPNTSPGSNATSTELTGFTFSGLDTGIWYAHVQAVDKAGNVGQVAHFRVQVTSEMSKKNVYNFPNPSRDGRTSIRWPLTTATPTLIRIYDEVGNLVWSRDLAAGETIAGVNYLVWDGRNDRGHEVGNGGYILQVSAGDKTITKKIAIVR